MTLTPMEARKQALYDKAHDAMDAGRRLGGSKVGPGPGAIKYGELAIRCLSMDSPVSVAEAEGYIGLALAYAKWGAEQRGQKGGLKDIVGKVWRDELGQVKGYGVRYDLRLELDSLCSVIQRENDEDRAEAEAIAAEPEPIEEDRRAGRESA